MKAKYIIALVAVGVLLVVYLVFAPSVSPFFPRCPFLQLTGLQCPGCGSQRAVHSLLNLDVLSALRYNALLVISIPALLFLFYVEMVRTRRPGLYVKVHQPLVIWTVLAVILIWWIGRNVVFLCK